MPQIQPSLLRTVRSKEGAVDLLRLLRYEARPLPYDPSGLGLGGEALRVTSDRSPSRGYGILIGELDSAPRSLRILGRRLVEQFHDRPLAVLGIRDGSVEWREVVVLRPRLIEGGAGAVSISRLTIDVRRPTMHDAEVVSGIAWEDGDEGEAHARIDRALNVERVTRRFFEGLREHHERLLAAVRAAGDQDAAVRAGLDRAGGAERVALRIVTQVLFCYFLQRKGLLAADRDWISNAFRREVAQGRFYERVLEPLFYAALALPVEARPPEWRRPGIPFLNGGLFERHYGEVALPLPDDVFSVDEGLLGFLDRWTFTVSEEAADESEVAVDPEMLGKVFESLISEEERRREGTIYTPRPVVQFMCREALVPYLEREAGLAEDDARLLLLDDEWLDAAERERGGEAALALARRLDGAVSGIHVLDPAVGSGAFLLGMMSELVRLRWLAHRVLNKREPGPRDVWRWKLDAIERSLFGVDVNGTAIELCRLRLWLSLLVEEEGGVVHALPNLEYRTISADALLDFVAAVEVQQTRRGALTLGDQIEDPARLLSLREQYFETPDPQEKERLRDQLAGEEDELVERIFARALAQAREARHSRTPKVRGEAEAAIEEELPALRERYRSRDRVFPLFLPGFHAPDVAAQGGWDIVIMNPPYVGRKEVAQRFARSYRADLERHYGRTYDLMLHFAFRAFELARTGGVVSMIFNDSIFTSTDATDVRRKLLPDVDGRIRLCAIARTRCFEGVAVNGGVVVAAEEPPAERPVRYVENHGRPPEDLAGASAPAEIGLTRVRESELWVAERRHFIRLPHRPLFRPSPEALALLNCFEESVAWPELRADWDLLSDTRRLDRWKRDQRRARFYDRLHGQRFVLLGLVVDGGVGLQTSDDRRFLAAVEGTAEAARALAMRERLERLVLERPEPARLYRDRRDAGRSVEDALLDVALEFRDVELGWPRIGLIRTAPPERVLTRRLGEDEVRSGIAGQVYFVPFEKGDDSAEGGGAAWRRDNPLVIDWSPGAVAELRGRVTTAVERRPYLRNEELWGQGGITWNRVASYLRAREVPDGAIFSDKAPTIRPTIEWLSIEGLLALMNAPVLDFALRTQLGSRMQVELGDVRRLPIPVLSEDESVRLTNFGLSAIAAKTRGDNGEASAATELREIERDLDFYVRELYGMARNAELWVVR